MVSKCFRFKTMHRNKNSYNTDAECPITNSNKQLASANAPGQKHGMGLQIMSVVTSLQSTCWFNLAVFVSSYPHIMQQRNSNSNCHAHCFWLPAVAFLMCLDSWGFATGVELATPQMLA